MTSNIPFSIENYFAYHSELFQKIDFQSIEVAINLIEAKFNAKSAEIELIRLSGTLVN